MEQSTTSCWIPHKTEAWELAMVLAEHEDGTVRVQTHHNSELTIARSGTHRSDPSHFLDHNDLCAMNHLHEAPLLHCLRRRFAQDKIYTTTGDVLLSLNPYKTIPGLYENPALYLDLPEDGSLSSAATAPHVYQTANRALCEMMRGKPGSVNDDSAAQRNQSIVVSGESGAGKTEASKLVMHFLIAADQTRDVDRAEDAETERETQDKNETSSENAATTESERETALLGDKIKRVLLQSNLILEAFGNAKTVRNDNSSRFGKYIKLQYCSQSRLVSAFTETFLLEKSRLMNISANERNYHFFYQFLRHRERFPAALCERLCLAEPNAFRVLVDSNGVAWDSLEDAQFDNVLAALRTLGATEREIESLLSLVAAILHCGNISVSAVAESEKEKASEASLAASVSGHDAVLGDVCISCSSAPLLSLCAMLGLPGETFVAKLATQRVKAGSRRSVSYKRLTQSEILNNVAALMKWLYASLFNWLVRKINAAHCSLNSDQSVVAKRFIGILDIFGFEILQVNSFEQLCINYTNERLQQQFNEFVFDREQAMYAEQGLDWAAISYRDNQRVIDLIGKRPTGLLLLLEGQGMLNRGGSADENALVAAFVQAHDKKNSAFEKSRFATDGKFSIKHFAGDVAYTVSGFLDKNNDALQDDLLELMLVSSDEFIQNAIVAQAVGAAVNEEKRGQCGFIEEIAPEKIVKSGVGDSAATTTSSGESAATTTSSVTRAASSRASVSAASKKTVSAQFRVQLDLLLSTLRATSPHYVKCVKPNAVKAAGVFDATMVLEQLKYSGALEVVRIRQEGFPINMSFEQFLVAFKVLSLGRGWTPTTSADTPTQAQYVRTLCGESLAEKQDFQLGVSRVFFRADAFERLYLSVQRALSQCVRVLQHATRRFLVRTRCVRRAAAKRLQACVRMWTARRAYLSLLEEKRRREEEERERERERLRREEEERERERKRKKEEEETAREREKERERERVLALAKERERERDLAMESQKEKERNAALERDKEKEREKEKEKEKERETQRERVRASTASAAQEPPAVRAPLNATIQPPLPPLARETERETESASTALDDVINNTTLSRNSPTQRLHAACRSGDIATVRVLLTAQPQLFNTRDEAHAQCTVLMSACASRENALSLVVALSPSPSDARERDAKGESALHYAARHGERHALGVVRYLTTLCDKSDREDDEDEEVRLCEERHLLGGVPRIRPAYKASSQLALTNKRESVSSSSRASLSLSPSLSPHRASYISLSESLSLSPPLCALPHHTAQLKEGWLSKRNGAQRWQRRFVRLTTTTLSYAHSPRDYLATDYFAFAHNSFTVRRTLHHAFAFAVSVGSCTLKKKRESLHFMCESERELCEWMHFLLSVTGNALPPLRPMTSLRETDRERECDANIERVCVPLCVVNMLQREKLFRAVNDAGESPLHTLCRHFAHSKSSLCERLSLAVWLVHNKCDVNAADREGVTALQIAIQHNHTMLAITLTREGADPTQRVATQQSKARPLALIQRVPSQDVRAAMQSAYHTYLVERTRSQVVLRGMHYFSVFLDHSVIEENNRYRASPERSGDFELRISAFDDKQQRIGDVAVFTPFVSHTYSEREPQRWGWAAAYELPIPLDNVARGTYLRMELVDVSHSPRVKVLARAKLCVDKRSVNTRVEGVKLLCVSDESQVHSTLMMETMVTLFEP